MIIKQLTATTAAALLLTTGVALADAVNSPVGQNRAEGQLSPEQARAVSDNVERSTTASDPATQAGATVQGMQQPNEPALSLEEQATDTVETGNPSAPPLETGSIGSPETETQPFDNSPGGPVNSQVTDPLEDKTDLTKQ